MTIVILATLNGWSLFPWQSAIVILAAIITSGISDRYFHNKIWSFASLFASRFVTWFAMCPNIRTCISHACLHVRFIRVDKTTQSLITQLFNHPLKNIPNNNCKSPHGIKLKTGVANVRNFSHYFGKARTNATAH